MSSYKPTIAQQQAIDASGNVLVSAAAGSGKTATLCRRIVEQLKSGGDVTRMLIVTFTRAAAQDLREKLVKTIRDELKNDPSSPSNKNLARQLQKTPHAQIGTTDSFCLDLVKRHAAELDLPSSFRLMDDSESSIFALDVMNRVIDDFYCKNDANFVVLCDTLTRNSDDEVAKTLLSLHYVTQSHPSGVDSLIRHESSQAFEQIIVEYVLKQLNFMEKSHYAALEYFATDETMTKKATAAFTSDLEFLERVRLACRTGIIGAISALENRPERWAALGRSGKIEDDELYVFYIDYRDNYFKKIISSKSKLGLPFSRATFESDSIKSAQNISTLHEVLSMFHVELREKKRQRGAFEHADIARFALELLLDEGKYSKIAQSVADGFDQVYVDEYQDTNDIQDMIYRAISRDNLFIIGDGKQSIYGFRGAKPEIFYSYRELFGQNNGGSNVFLSENFRCSQNIVDTGNAVLGALFPHSGTPYLEQDQLVHSKPEADPLGEPCVGIHICPTTEAEYDLLVNLVHEQVKSRRMWQDIAVLVSKNDTAVQVAQHLEAHGVPVSLEGSKRNFWDNPQVRSLLCLLAAAVNPTNDIYLAGALSSERFRATVQDLAIIRLNSESANLYQSVLEMQEKCSICAEFVEFVTEMRRVQARYPTNEIVRSLLAETFGDESLYHAKSAHLRKFCSIADNYQANSANPDLAGFVRYIEMLSNQGKSDESNVVGNAVSVMTIHKSKGLEFPVCFLFGAGKTLKKANKSKILYDGELGAASVVLDGLSERKAHDFAAIGIIKEENEQNEAIRRLYVALTRAKSEMIVIGSPRKHGANLPDLHEYRKKCEFEANLLCGTLLHQRSSYLQWILLALYSCNAARGAYEIHVHENVAPSRATHEKIAVETAESSELVVVPIEQKMPQIPAKLSVSRLHPTVLDEMDDGAAVLESDIELVFDAPNFITEHQKPHSTQLRSGREVGIATHAFMQFCDFAYVEKHGVYLECVRLTDRKFLSPSVAQLVDIAQIEAFFASSLYNEMKNASILYRERRFNVKLPAAEFTAENAELLGGESVLVQGVIDCYFIDSDDKLTLVDYKTDNFPSEMLQNSEMVAAILRKRHKLQLQYYCMAIERLTKRKVDRVALYSFALGDVVEVVGSD